MAAPGTQRDPRAARLEPAGVVPRVALPRRGISTPAIVIGAFVAAMLLFGVLEARRRSLSAPAVEPRVADLPGSSAPPPLYIPREPPPPPSPVVYPPIERVAPVPAPQLVAPPAPPPQIVYVPQPAPVGPRIAPPRNAGGPTLVIDNGSARATNAPADVERDAPAGQTSSAAPRARAGVLANRSTTVSQGTLIAAVLETAFDSSRPGFARALVQRDVRGFDGTKILIPRGSRLIGEYGADAATGQKRAMVAWSRLIRPDGVSIAVGSPAADPLGRGGIKAKVDTHFLERFSGAILQSALDIGVNLASRAADTQVVVGLPGSLNGAASSTTRPTEIAPTLKVQQGTSITVFVARDLDFTDVENGR